jgi:hypothetical protein
LLYVFALEVPVYFVPSRIAGVGNYSLSVFKDGMGIVNLIF